MMTANTAAPLRFKTAGAKNRGDNGYIWISYDIDENGNEDNLIANGFATKYDLSKDKHWSHVKWCCKIDPDGIIHESDLKK
jgi:hypothetical protein